MSNKLLDEEDIFKVACKLGSLEARADYLKQACGDDRALSDRLAALLRVHDEQQSFLESLRPGLVATIGTAASAERPGQTIGRYKLLEEIAEGGMGVVYMAEQREPVRRKVALKIIKPGMDTREVIARFEAERQALAMMDHPNIAKVFDAGETESGRSYFVMELVHGTPLTDYCDQNELTVRQRLELFVQVCQTVHHAHQKGIIHRDLKPSNVMVTLYDGVPVPKVIDFGIAKAINGPLTDRSVFTHFGQMIGTPLYMSPEQAEMRDLDVDTRSDIYSLGVMLYELLTGSTPFDQERVKTAGYDEIRRIIREDEPQQPSTRISTLGAAAATVISTQRKTDPARLSGLLRRDLDWIVMKALEKDRTRRYETASDFARDIQRYLADEPIAARRPTLRGRLVKWARRHRTIVSLTAVSLFGAAAAAIFFGVIFLVSTGEGTVKLEFADADAARQCNVSVDGNEIRIEKLGEPIKLRPGRHQLRIRHGDLKIEAREFDVLQRGTQVLHVSIPAQSGAVATAGPAEAGPPDDSSRAHDLVESARALGNEGFYSKAIAEFDQAIKLAPEDTGAWLDRAKAETADGQLDGYRKHCAEMLRYFAKQEKVAHGGCKYVCRTCTLVPDAVTDWSTAIALADSAVKMCPEDAAYMATRGAVLYRAGRWKEALGPLAEGHRLSQKVLKNDPNPYLRLDGAFACAYLAMAHQRLGHREEARKWFDTMVEQTEASMEEHRSGRVYFYWNVQAEMKLLRPEAAKLLGIADTATAAKRASRPTTATAGAKPEYLVEMARGLAAVGKHEEAIAILQKLARDDQGTPAARELLAKAYCAQGDAINGWKIDKAEKALECYRAAARLQPQAVEYRRRQVEALYHCMDQRMWHSQFDLARQDGDAAVQLCPDDLFAYAARVGARSASPPRDYKAMIADCRKMAELATQPTVTLVFSQHTPAFAQWTTIAYNALADLGRASQYRHDVDRAIESYKKAQSSYPDPAFAFIMCGDAYRQKGDFPRAIAELDQGISPEHPADPPSDKAAAYYLRAFCHGAMGDAQAALDDLRSGEQLHSDDLFPSVTLAWCLATCPNAEIRNPQRAVEAARKAVEAWPRTSWHVRSWRGNPWAALGVAQYRAGRWQEAIEAFQQSADRVSSEEPGDWLFRAMAHWQLGQKDEARKWFDKADAWMTENNIQEEELGRFRTEAAKLLGIAEKPSPAKQPPEKPNDQGSKNPRSKI